MKKSIIFIFTLVLTIVMLSIVSSAVELTIESPADTETEIMAGRDFYVVGKINRGNEKASENPVNIRIELFDERGKTVRSLLSNVSPDGVTPGLYFMTDYENGSGSADAKGSNILQFAPPDIVYDGEDRDSIRAAHNKILVKEDYFAATIYSGATKDFELKYEDAYEQSLSDITAGRYKLVVTAVNSDGEEVASCEKMLTFGNSKSRLIASDSIKTIKSEDDLTTSDSIVGKWVPKNYAVTQNEFTYTIPNRYLNNIITEYGNAKQVSVMLYDINMNDTAMNYKIGSAFAKDTESKKTFLYYDIGEDRIEYSFNGAKLAKNGTVIKHKSDQFVEILRSETTDEANDTTYVDFSTEDGFVLTKGNKTTFYAVYSPMITETVISGSQYKLNDKVNLIKVVLTDEASKVVYEAVCNPYIIRGDSAVASRYEFSFDIKPDSNMLKSDKLQMTVVLYDAQERELISSEPIAVKVNNSGDFIGGFDDSYWGKSFCDTVNYLGQNPSGVALNPDEHITRGDFAAMINRLFGYSIEGKNVFSDLENDNVFYSDCLTASEIGYMTGDEQSRVKANELISREQAMIILARISGAPMGDKNINFIDREQISFWAEDYVNIMCSNGIVTGFDGYLHPTDSITVAEAAALIIKTIKWMYNNGEETDAPVSDTAVDVDMSGFDLSEVEFISDVNLDTVSAFYTANSDIFASVVSYIQRNCLYGAYIGKVGTGLEIRDYSMGDYITLSDDALSVIVSLSSKFAVFALKYNPTSENAIHFILGQNEDGKDIGLTYTLLNEVKGKTLAHIDGDWYYFVQN